MGMSGADLIAAERWRQMESEGFSPEHDDKHQRGDLIAAAHAYIHEAETQIVFDLPVSSRPPKKWPWEKEWWKPSPDPIRNLTKAAALIAAEIDRLQRAKESTGTKP